MNFRKLLKIIHLVFFGVWLGGAAAGVCLAAAKSGSTAPELIRIFDYAVYRLHKGPVVYSYFGILVTGFLFSMFTPYGFLRHRWIIVKWAVMIILFPMTAVWGGPAIDGMTALSDVGRALGPEASDYAGFSASAGWFNLAQLILILVLVVVSVLKPWGAGKPPRAINLRIRLAVTAILLIPPLGLSIIQAAQLQKTRNLPVADTDLSRIRDGTYHGRADCLGFDYRVEVTVSDRTITAIEIVRNRTGRYARFAEGVTTRILEFQNANVDTVTAASTTSKCLMKAVENALSR